MKRSLFSSVSLAILLAIIPSASISQPGKGHDLSGYRARTVAASRTHYVPLDINNIFNYFGNNGDESYNPFSSNHEGFELYEGTGKCIFYEGGMVWGGYHKGRAIPKVGGSANLHALQPGRILNPGTRDRDPIASDPSNPANRIYRVKPDIAPYADSAAAIAAIAGNEFPFLSRYELTTASRIYEQYIKDWNEWPAAEGAPYTDVDGNGQYDPAVDIPGQPGADQTLWYVANDLDSTLTKKFAGSPPIGIEMQRTVWGYKRNMGALTNAIFVSTRLINKSDAPIDSMFISQWSDPDVGDAGDDRVGFDLQRSLAYAYNGRPVDGLLGTTLPAGGFTLIQGPVVPSAATDSAISGRGYRRGYKNLPVSAFIQFAPEFAEFAAPDSGDGGDLQWFRAVNGLIPHSGLPYIDPTTNKPTKIILTGDPVLDPGWLSSLVPSDVQMLMSIGPLSMAAGDTQEIVVAQVGALGVDRLMSIVAMRNAVDALREQYHDILTLTHVPVPKAPPDVPHAYVLYQNYPNPFNPLTTIRYGIPVRSTVSLTVYNTIGQKVVTLVNETQEAGYHDVRFDGNGLASEVYFYRLSSSGFVKTNRMIFVR